MHKMENINQLHQLITSASSIAIFPHEDPDADCLSSACGLGIVLKALGKTITIVEADRIPEYLAGIFYGSEMIVSELPLQQYDLLICLDTSNAELLDPISYPKYLRNTSTPIINIDHHQTNTHYGTLNIIDALASAEGELLSSLCRKLEIAIPSEAAHNFLLGTIFDTQYFKVPSTSAQTFYEASSLIQQGANLQQILSAYSNPPSVDEAYMFSHLLSLMQTTPDKSIVWISIPLSLEKQPYFDSAIKSLISYMNSLKGVAIALKFTEEEAEDKKGTNIKVSLRSKTLDISPIAALHNGGGHKNASGCKLYNISREEAETTLVKECQKLVENKVTAEK